MNYKNTQQAENTIELLSSSFDLVRGVLDYEDWLKVFAAVMNADAAACVRWTCGNPEKFITSNYGESGYLKAGWTNWADHICNLAKVADCHQLDDLADSLNRPALAEADPLDHDQVMVVVADWSPAYICMFAYREPGRGPWTEEDRDNFVSVCRLIRKSMRLHKDYSRTKNIAAATADILNASPRGILALSMDGEIQFANSLAIDVLGLNDGLSAREGHFHIKDKNARAKLNEFIDTTRAMQIEQLNVKNPESVSNFKAKRNSEGSSFQIMLSSIPLSSWSIESSPSDRMVLAYIHDPNKNLLPSSKQMMDFYDLTKAQARVAATLCTSENIVTTAETLNISVHTARSHLRVIYQKTNTNNQHELAKLLTSTLKSYGANEPN